MPQGLQVFLINSDGTTTEIKTDGPIKDVLKSEECYVIVSDELRKVILWKGLKSNVRSKFIGAKRSQEIRGQVGLHYSGEAVDEGDEDDDLIRILGGRTEGGIAKEIREDKPQQHPLRQKPIFEPPRPAEGMNIAGSLSRPTNSGPLYTGEPMTYFEEEAQINFNKKMKKLEEIAIPDGYERELIIIGNSAYSIVEKVQTFLGKKQVEKVIEKVSSIPDGIFFAEDYSPRVLSENGKILAIEFLKRVGQKTQPAQYKDKKEILKEQLKQQLGAKQQ